VRDTGEMDPATLTYALWGVLGATANLGVVFLEASKRVKGWPWARPHGPGGGVYTASVVIQLGIAAGTTAAASTVEVVSSGLIAFGIGAAAPTVVKKIARTAESFLPDQDDQDRLPTGGDSDGI
jgi:hypothetical protein